MPPAAQPATSGKMPKFLESAELAELNSMLDSIQAIDSVVHGPQLFFFYVCVSVTVSPMGFPGNRRVCAWLVAGHPGTGLRGLAQWCMQDRGRNLSGLLRSPVCWFGVLKLIDRAVIVVFFVAFPVWIVPDQAEWRTTASRGHPTTSAWKRNSHRKFSRRYLGGLRGCSAFDLRAWVDFQLISIPFFAAVAAISRRSTRLNPPPHTHTAPPAIPVRQVTSPTTPPGSARSPFGSLEMRAPRKTLIHLIGGFARCRRRAGCVHLPFISLDFFALFPAAAEILNMSFNDMYDFTGLRGEHFVREPDLDRVLHLIFSTLETTIDGFRDNLQSRMMAALQVCVRVDRLVGWLVGWLPGWLPD